MNDANDAATDPVSAFIRESVWHGSIEQPNAILAAHPEVATANIYTAAILGDDGGLPRFLAADHGNATRAGGPLGWDALTHLCFSKYLGLDPSRSEAFVRAATALLDAGASANTGFFDESHRPSPEWESVLYGAAGVAHHAPMTRLLLERGAEPNDIEAVYHSPETRDDATLKLLVGTGKLMHDNLVLMLIRKHDWHHYEGVKFLLEQGIDVNRATTHGRWVPLHHAIARDNDLSIIELLLDHGADPTVTKDGISAVEMAARKGRGDVLAVFAERGVPIALLGVDRLIAACARNDVEGVRAIAADDPALGDDLRSQGGKLLAEFAGTANTAGVAHLLDLGVDVGALYAGDGYFGIAPRSTALHVAAWRAWHDTVKLLIARGANVDATDAEGRTPLALAVKACVDSYWTYRRSPESVEALLRAGASVQGIPFPTGYAAIDELLHAAGT